MRKPEAPERGRHLGVHLVRPRRVVTCVAWVGVTAVSPPDWERPPEGPLADTPPLIEILPLLLQG